MGDDFLLPDFSGGYEPARREAFDSLLSVQEAGPRTWRLTSPLIWEGTKGDRLTVPLGFVTDFATVPRVLHWKVSPYGPYTRAAVLHDWLLRILLWWHRLRARLRAGHPVAPEDAPEDVRTIIFSEGLVELRPSPPITSRDIDGIFRRAMEDLGVRWDRRWVMWAAVRVGALFSSYRRHGRGFALDLPRVFAIGLLATVTTLPGTVGVIISLIPESAVNAIHRLLTKRPGGPGARKD